VHPVPTDSINPDNPDFPDPALNPKRRVIMIFAKRFASRLDLEDNVTSMSRIAVDLMEEIDFALTCLPKVLCFTEPLCLRTSYDLSRDGHWTRITGTFEVERMEGESEVEIMDL
jgi:hypothetical protein